MHTLFSNKTALQSPELVSSKASAFYNYPFPLNNFLLASFFKLSKSPIQNELFSSLTLIFLNLSLGKFVVIAETVAVVSIINSYCITYISVKTGLLTTQQLPQLSQARNPRISEDHIHEDQYHDVNLARNMYQWSGLIKFTRKELQNIL